MANKIDMHNVVSSEQASLIIEHAAKALLSDPAVMAHKISPIMLRGAPGVGKSTIVKAVADKLGIGFIDIRLAEMEPVDLRGLPVPNQKDKSVEWFVTSDLPRDPESKGIILFDELTSADKSLQVASYELILDRRLGNLYKLPDGWFIVAAGNRTTDKAVATAMSSALANRLMHFELEANAEDWVKWATQHDIHPSVTGFIRYRPMNLSLMEKQNLEQGWPSPRSWERVSTTLNVYKGLDETDEGRGILEHAVYGLIGNSVGCEFMAFHKINKNFGNVLKLLTDPEADIVVPERSDEKYAFVSALSYLVWNGKSEDDDKKRIDGVFRVAMKLTDEFATMLFKSVMLGNSRVPRIKACIYAKNSPLYAAFAAKYQNALKAA